MQHDDHIFAWRAHMRALQVAAPGNPLYAWAALSTLQTLRFNRREELREAS
jgi:hypothetical protein